MGQKLLIVDDESHIRMLIEQTLEDLEDEGVELLFRRKWSPGPGDHSAGGTQSRLFGRDDAQDERNGGLPKSKERS